MQIDILFRGIQDAKKKINAKNSRIHPAYKVIS